MSLKINRYSIYWALPSIQSLQMRIETKLILKKISRHCLTKLRVVVLLIQLT